MRIAPWSTFDEVQFLTGLAHRNFACFKLYAATVDKRTKWDNLDSERIRKAVVELSALYDPERVKAWIKQS